jgi:hypothetical protein
MGLEDILNRQANNQELINLISDYIDTHSEMRFIQALWSLNIIDRDENGIIDRFYEEPNDTLNRIKKGT